MTRKEGAKDIVVHVDREPDCFLKAAKLRSPPARVGYPSIPPGEILTL